MNKKDLEKDKLIRDLLIVLEQYDDSANNFIRKVHDGKARSIETYEDLSKCLRDSKLIKINWKDMIHEIQ